MQSPGSRVHGGRERSTLVCGPQHADTVCRLGRCTLRLPLFPANWTMSTFSMNSALPNLLVTYAVCTVVLFFVVKVCNFYGANMDDHPPEDALLGTQPPVPDDIKRRMRLIMNNLENAPMDLALFWAAFISVLVQSSSGGKEEALALNVLLPIYTAGRLVYAVAYARGLQPLRTICFATSTSCTVAAAGVLLSSASKAYMMTT